MKQIKHHFMEKSHLRLYSWIEVPEKVRQLIFETCHELEFPRFAQVSQVSNDGIVHLLDGKGDELDFELQDLKPISLTEEILTDWFGFDDSEYKKGFIGVDFKSGMMTLDFVLTKPEQMGPWQTYYSFDLGQNRFTPVYFVHELQNLFEPVTRQQLKKIA